MPQSVDEIYGNFKPAGKADWEKLALKELKTPDAYQKLFTKTAEGIEKAPFYNTEDLHCILHNPVLKTRRGWKIVERIKLADADNAQKSAGYAFEKGADEVMFLIEGETDAGTLPSGQNIKYRITGKIPANTGSLAVADPLGYLVKTGDWMVNEAADTEVIKNFKGTFEVDASVYHNAGAEPATVLAFALAHANEYLTIAGPEIARRMVVNAAIGPDYFMEIASLRALRKLWALLMEQYFSGDELVLYAETGLRNKTIYDYNNNILRSTTEAMAAIIGGCDALYLHRYDKLFKNPNDFSERISRNVQLVLENESHFAKVQDAAAGSFYIENLTEKVAERAWEIFKDIEAKGGWLACIKSGYIQDITEAQAHAAQLAVNENRKTVLGVNKYPNKNEKMKGEIEVPPPAAAKETPVRTLPLRRLAEIMEQERMEKE